MQSIDQPLQRLNRYADRSATIGAILWLAVAVWMHPVPTSSGYAELLILLSAFVLVPLGLRVATGDARIGLEQFLYRIVVVLQLPCAVALAWSFLIPVGTLAGILAACWMLPASVAALLGIARLLSRKSLSSPPTFALDIALVYLAVGAGWTVMSRLGLHPLDFDDTVVLLTGVHFHVAGFILPLLAYRAVSNTLTGPMRYLPLVAVSGMAFTAAGITASQLGYGNVPETLAALVMAVTGGVTGALHFRNHEGITPIIRVLRWLTGFALICGMLLAASYGLRSHLPYWLNIGWMRAVHGSLNVFAVICGLLAWRRSV